MSANSKIKEIIAKLKNKKQLEIIIAVVAVVVMLALYFSTKSGCSQKAPTVSETTKTDYCERMESEMVKALGAMKGVGKVSVVISWESGVETVIAYATNSSGNNVTTTPTIIQSQGSSSPIVLKELYPKALGVIIICEGGNEIAVKLDVMNAVSGLLDIPQSKVNVYAMKSK